MKIQYKYGDVVHVTQGFYEGMFGDVFKKDWFGLKYQLELNRTIKEAGAGRYNGDTYAALWIWQFELCKPAAQVFNEKLEAELKK